MELKRFRPHAQRDRRDDRSDYASCGGGGRAIARAGGLGRSQSSKVPQLRDDLRRPREDEADVGPYSRIYMNDPLESCDLGRQFPCAARSFHSPARWSSGSARPPCRSGYAGIVRAAGSCILNGWEHQSLPAALPGVSDNFIKSLISWQVKSLHALMVTQEPYAAQRSFG
jgi:hypothetical protein